MIESAENNGDYKYINEADIPGEQVLADVEYVELIDYVGSPKLQYKLHFKKGIVSDLKRTKAMDHEEVVEALDELRRIFGNDKVKMN